MKVLLLGKVGERIFYGHLSLRKAVEG
jgi:hypothetical protein